MLCCDQCKATAGDATRLLRGDPSLRAERDSPSSIRKKLHLRTLHRFLEVGCWKLPCLQQTERALNIAADGGRQINRIVQWAKTDDLYEAAVYSKTGERLDENSRGRTSSRN